MTFQRRPEMDAWFAHLHKDNSLELLFDNYYLSLMIGLASLRDDPLSNGDELVRRFPTPYFTVGKLVIGLLLIAETEKLGKKLTDKGDVEFLVNQYLDPNDANSLNEAGFERLNRYANGGFNYLVERHNDKPYHADSFLAWYSKEIRSLTTTNELWASQSPKTL